MLARVVAAGQPAFQLRKGEQGLSLFDLEAVTPPLNEFEVLQCFRSGSSLRMITKEDIERKGLVVIAVPGAESLPERLQAAHMEIRPGAGMSRKAFKQALTELEAHES